MNKLCTFILVILFTMKYSDLGSYIDNVGTAIYQLGYTIVYPAYAYYLICDVESVIAKRYSACLQIYDRTISTSTTVKNTLCDLFDRATDLASTSFDCFMTFYEFIRNLLLQDQLRLNKREFWWTAFMSIFTSLFLYNEIRRRTPPPVTTTTTAATTDIIVSPTRYTPPRATIFQGAQGVVTPVLSVLDVPSTVRTAIRRPYAPRDVTSLIQGVVTETHLQDCVLLHPDPAIGRTNTLAGAQYHCLIPTRSEAELGYIPGTENPGDSPALGTHVQKLEKNFRTAIFQGVAATDSYKAYYDAVEAACTHSRFGASNEDRIGAKWNTIHSACYRTLDSRDVKIQLGAYLESAQLLQLRTKAKRDSHVESGDQTNKRPRLSNPSFQVVN